MALSCLAGAACNSESLGLCAAMQILHSDRGPREVRKSSYGGALEQMGCSAVRTQAVLGADSPGVWKSLAGLNVSSEQLVMQLSNLYKKSCLT